jgi:hypothetical protein
VLLTKKLAQKIDGVDLSAHKVGDVFDVNADDGRLLLAEQWAIPDRRSDVRNDRRESHVGSARDTKASRLPTPSTGARATSAADRPRRHSSKDPSNGRSSM